MKKTSRPKMFKLHAVVMAISVSALLLSACGNNNNSAVSAGTPEGGKVSAKVTTVTNWFAQAEHGGVYAALEEGFYKDAGLDMTITPGGPQISATQIVASGKAEFGMAQADEILLARQNGIPLVALFASFQTNPQGLVVHKDAGIASPDNLHGKSVYVSSGAGYWEYLKKAYSLSDVKQMAYTGSAAPFLADSNVVLQGYVTSEPFEMKNQNVDVDFLLNADFGYNPYGNVLFTTEDYLKKHGDVVKAFVEATAKGFEAYKTDYKTINEAIQKESPDMTTEKLTYASETMMPLVFDGDAKEHGVGYMSKERWETLAKQMTDTGLLDKMPDVSEVYTDEYFTK
ncbi:ABC transporter substrate-binding protein [Paenibacillus protaetiae]|uniref:Myristoyl transferase n=1 Tax=Paenibacillus protaetiae TaxID=2509456 RepID=A0A4P6EXH9_9BACL|nr:ABC transporter substrate-binding protein [Paenibacillus protaetiae]QAY66459.1 myristoyl transferase [Paenibacillus protaetiae]